MCLIWKSDNILRDIPTWDSATIIDFPPPITGIMSNIVVSDEKFNILRPTVTLQIINMRWVPLDIDLN